MILKKYLSQQIVKTTLSFIIILSLIIWLTQFIDILKFLATKHFDIGIFFQLILFILPKMILIILPIAMFIVVLWVLARLNHDYELTIFKSVGLSYLDIAKPVLRISFFVVILGYVTAIFIQPVIHNKYKDLKVKVREETLQLFIEEGQFQTLDDHFTVYVHQQNGPLYQNILIHDQTKPDKTITYFAKQGYILEQDNHVFFVLEQGYQQEYNPTGHEMITISFEKNIIDLEALKPSTPNLRILEASERSLRELLFTKAETLETKNVKNFRAEAHFRLTYPLQILSLTLIALVVFLRSPYQRSGSRNAIIMACALAILCHLFYFLCHFFATQQIWANLFCYMLPITTSFICWYYLRDKPYEA